MGFERHKEIILQAVGTHLRMENICCLMARDHTGQVSGQGVSDLENTMHVHHPSSKIMSCSTSLAIPMQTVLKPNKISMSIKKCLYSQLQQNVENIWKGKILSA